MRERQAALFAPEEAPRALRQGQQIGPPPYPAQPSKVICSVSGGVDSAATAVWARQRWPKAELILWHAYLADMDWPQTPESLDELAAKLGNCRRVTIQPVYELTGRDTPTGFRSTRLRRLHDVEAHGPATDSDQDAILTLADFWERARLGMPPTLRRRYCTDYFKQAPFESWVVRNRAMLGTSAVLLSGERWAESDNRARVNSWEWRKEVELRNGWRLLWARPLIDQALWQVSRLVVDAGISLHPGYAIQGETPESMCDPNREEAHRARLSCVTCIFTQQKHLRTALANEPALVQPYIQRIETIEQRTGKTWQQSGAIMRAATAAERLIDR